MLCSGKESEKWINGLIRGQVQLGRTEDHLGTHLSDAHPLMDRLFGWELARPNQTVRLKVRLPMLSMLTPIGSRPCGMVKKANRSFSTTVREVGGLMVPESTAEEDMLY